MITGLPAKYFDPLTEQPYANLAAFKKIREIFKSEQDRDDKKYRFNVSPSYHSLVLDLIGMM